MNSPIAVALFAAPPTRWRTGAPAATWRPRSRAAAWVKYLCGACRRRPLAPTAKMRPIAVAASAFPCPRCTGSTAPRRAPSLAAVAAPGVRRQPRLLHVWRRPRHRISDASISFDAGPHQRRGGARLGVPRPCSARTPWPSDPAGRPSRRSTGAARPSRCPRGRRPSGGGETELLVRARISERRGAAEEVQREGVVDALARLMRAAERRERGSGPARAPRGGGRGASAREPSRASSRRRAAARKRRSAGGRRERRPSRVVGIRVDDAPAPRTSSRRGSGPAARALTRHRLMGEQPLLPKARSRAERGDAPRIARVRGTAPANTTMTRSTVLRRAHPRGARPRGTRTARVIGRAPPESEGNSIRRVCCVRSSSGLAVVTSAARLATGQPVRLATKQNMRNAQSS